MKRSVWLGLLIAAAVSVSGARAEEACTKIVATGHPEYPVMAFKDGDEIKGAAPLLVAELAEELERPIRVQIYGLMGRRAVGHARRQGRHDHRRLFQ